MFLKFILLLLSLSWIVESVDGCYFKVLSKETLYQEVNGQMEVYGYNYTLFISDKCTGSETQEILNMFRIGNNVVDYNDGVAKA